MTNARDALVGFTEKAWKEDSTVLNFLSGHGLHSHSLLIFDEEQLCASSFFYSSFLLIRAARVFKEKLCPSSHHFLLVRSWLQLVVKDRQAMPPSTSINPSVDIS